MNNSAGLIGQGDITRVFAIIRKNWWIVVLISALGYGLGNFYTYKLTNVYGASTQILLRSNDQIKQGSLISDNPYYGPTVKTYIDNSNEKRILTSYDMISYTMDRLDFDVSYFIVGRIRTEEVFTAVPFYVTVGQISPQFYEQKMLLRFLGNDKYSLKYTKNEVDIEVAGQFGKDLITDDFHLLIANRNTSKGGGKSSTVQADYQIQIHSKPSLVSRYQSSIVVESPEYTNILQISVEDVIPERAVMFLDTLIQVYIENSLEQRMEVNQNTVFFIDRQLQEVTNILNNIEDTLQNYREDNIIIDLDNESEQFFGQFMNFDNRKRSYQMQIEALNDLEEYIKTNKDPQFLPPAAFFSFGDQFLDQSVTQLYSMQLQYTSLLTQATPGNPDLVNLDSSISRQRKNMLTYIGNNKLAIIENLKATNRQIDTSIFKLQGIPVKQRGLININRNLQVNEGMYIFLLQKRATTIIARAGILPETKIIDKARSMGIVRPNRSMINYYFAGGAFILSLLIVFLRVVFYGRIESYEELKAATHLPIVGEVIYTLLAEDTKLVVDSDPKSPVAESFRTVRTNLQYMLGEAQRGVILITSNSPGEGKTFCSINLAGILAKGGKRTVLLELDLHKPRVHKGLGLENVKGFSTIAIGRDKISDCVVPTHLENLDVILSGPLPPNPSEIVVSKTLTEILSYCKDNYEYVIVDTPPVGLITDALVLMKHANVSLFVLNTKAAYRNALANAHDIVAMNKDGHFGFILNGVKRKKSKYYYNRYSYGYGYGSYGSSAYGGYGSYGGYGDKGSFKSSSSKKK